MEKEEGQGRDRGDRGSLGVRAERIRLWHRANGTDRVWTTERVMRLCRLMHCLPEELAAYATVSPKKWNRYIKRNCVPATVALHFVGLERAYILAVGKGHPKPAMPVGLFK